MKSKFFLSLFLIQFFNFSNAQIIVRLDGEPITNQYTYSFFFCPSYITVSDLNYDSLLVEKITVSYHDLKENKAVTTSFNSDSIDINPYGIQTAAISAKSEPIVIKLEKIYGYKKGKKVKIEITDKVYTVSYGSAKFKDEALFTKINSRSKLCLSINDSIVKANNVLLVDTVKTWKIHAPQGMNIHSGTILTIKILPKGAPAPTRQVDFNSEEELHSEIYKLLKVVQPGEIIFFKEVYLKKRDDNILSKAESLVYEVK